jgi:hypothetical protein
MKKTPAGTSVGVENPYAFVERCDHLTDDGRCRYALENPDSAFARERRADDFRCPVVTDAGPDWGWQDCPHFRARNRSRECVRCGLDERRQAHSDERPLLEEHHLSYPDAAASHEITVYLCRWCHAKIHRSWAHVDDDVTPDTEALAARESRRSREQAELDFASAAKRREEDR